MQGSPAWRACDVAVRAAGKAGVALSTLGPGATNFTTSAAYAQLGGFPMLLITGVHSSGCPSAAQPRRRPNGVRIDRAECKDLCVKVSSMSAACGATGRSRHAAGAARQARSPCSRASRARSRSSTAWRCSSRCPSSPSRRGAPGGPLRGCLWSQGLRSALRLPADGRSCLTSASPAAGREDRSWLLCVRRHCPCQVCSAGVPWRSKPFEASAAG